MSEKVYGIKIKDNQERLLSQSGGAFYCMAKNFIVKGGVVYGVALNEDIVAEYKRVDDLHELQSLRGSKYVQAKIGKTFINVKDDLINSRDVLFSGTPCCVKGLLLFLHSKHINTSRLVTCDNVCHGVPSPLIFSEYINYISDNHSKEINNFKFRDKCKGWHSLYETYTINNTKYCSNIYGNLFSSANCLRESCYECKFTNYQRPSDITIGDFWGIEKYYPELDDNLGISLMMINSKKGLDLFDYIKNDIIYFESNEKEISQPQLNHPYPKAKTFDQFWDDYRKRNFKYIIYKYGKGGIKGICRTYLIDFTTKLGIFDALHNIWMKIK